jgi:hypothetical protein
VITILKKNLIDESGTRTVTEREFSDEEQLIKKVSS